MTGKKVYGYLKKPLKDQVDAIVDELAKVPQVADCFETWNRLRDELESYYKDSPRQHLPLSRQREFKAVKNMVVQEAKHLRLGVLTFEDEQLADELPDNTRFRDPDISSEDKRSVIEVLERDWGDDGPASVAFLLGRLWRDGLGVIPDDEKTEMWFRRATETGHSDAQYALAKLLQGQGKITEAIPWYEQAAEGGNQFAGYQLGKLYLQGAQVEKNPVKAVGCLTDAPSRAAYRPSTFWASCISWVRMWSRTIPQPSIGSPRPQARDTSTHNSSSTTWSRNAIHLFCSAPPIFSVQWPRLSGRPRRQRRPGYTLTANSSARFRRRRSPWAISRTITRSRAGAV